MKAAVLPLFIASMALGDVGSDPYIRSRVDTGITNDPKAHCLWWGDTNIAFHQNDKGNPDINQANPPVAVSEFTAFHRALDTWNQAATACSSIALSEGDLTPSRNIGWEENGPNENILVYRMEYCGNVVQASDPCWQDQTCQNKYDCFDQAKATIAITTTTYDRKTGQIFDADIEGNGRYFLFTTVDAPKCPDGGPYSEQCVATDVQNTFTHELGHALGLDHTLAPGSTMNPSAPGGETSKRVLDPGTKGFLCDVYPKGAPPKDCVIAVANPVIGTAASGCEVSGPTAALALLGAWAAAQISRRRRRP